MVRRAKYLIFANTAMIFTTHNFTGSQPRVSGALVNGSVVITKI